MFKRFPFELQFDKTDCGPTCLRLIARSYGVYYSLQYLRDICGKSKHGVSFFDLSAACDRIGFRSVAIRATTDQLQKKVLLPCIAHWKGTHFVVVYRVSRTKVFVADPAAGRVSYDLATFQKNWYAPDSGYGNILLMEPSVEFTSKGPIRKQSNTRFLPILRYFFPYASSIRNLIVIMLVVTLLQLCLPFLSKAVIDVGIKSGDLTFIQMVLVANIAIATSMMVGNVGRDWILQHISSRVNLAMVSEYLIKLLKLPVSFFETKSVGDILQRAQDLERIRSFIMNNWLNTVFSAVSFLVFSFVLFIFNLKVFAIFAVGSLVYIGWVMAFLNIRKKLDWDYFELIAKNQSYWVEIVESIYDIKNFNYDTSRRWAWERIQASLYRTNLRALGINNLQNSGAGFIDSLKNILITFFCATQVIQGTMSFGVMVSTQFIIGSLNGPVSQFIQFIIALQAAKISYSRLSEVHEIDDETASDGMITVDTLFKKDIVLSNVTYLYSPNQPPVVRGVGFVIPQGKVTAIVGASGSGKSTLLKMLLRLYNPSYGDIFIGDMNLRNISLRDWRSRCGAVMQEGRIFNDTVLNNIILEDSNPDMERYNNAILAANIATEIEQMPQGYHTKLGEDGQGISGGQRQRILIARALYREPEYLFLDEATNSLDAVNERKVIDALENAYRGKTVVVVAHRLSTIINADQIVVLDKGYVVEQGSHTELFEKGGAYWRLVSTQFSHQTL